MSNGAEKPLSGPTAVDVFWELYFNSGLTREEVANRLEKEDDYVRKHLKRLAEETNIIYRKRKEKREKKPALPFTKKDKNSQGAPPYLFYLDRNRFENLDQLFREARQELNKLTNGNSGKYFPKYPEPTAEEKYELERADYAVSLAEFTDLMEIKSGRGILKEKWPYDWEDFKRRWGNSEEREDIGEYECKDIREKME